MPTDRSGNGPAVRASGPHSYLPQSRHLATTDPAVALPTGRRSCRCGAKWIARIYIHLEVQGTAQGEFAERMFVYNYRIYDRYRRPVASMAVLADDRANWKPQEFGFEVLGCKHTLQFPVAKLRDYAEREQSLQDDPNPFALVTLAHLQTRATRQDRRPALRPNGNWYNCCTAGAGTSSALGLKKAYNKACSRAKPWPCKNCCPRDLALFRLRSPAKSPAPAPSKLMNG